MKVVNTLLLPLLTAGLTLPGAVLAHPGHEHAPGALERLQHAAIGWDQLSLLLIVGAIAAVYFLTRSKK